MIIRYTIFVITIITNILNISAQQQVHIPWPTLADSPWPMMKHDPQATGRSPYLGPKTPNIVWTLDMPYGILSGPAIGVDNNLYFGSNSWLPSLGTNFFYSAYPTGELRWEYSTGDANNTMPGFLIGSDSTVYFGSQDGYLYAVTLDGKLKWKSNTGGNIWQAIMNTDLDGNLYVLNNTDSLYSYRRDGELNWRVSYEGGLFSKSVSIAPDGQTLYIAGRDSNLFALNLNGSMKWKYSCGEIWDPVLIDNAGRIYVQPDEDTSDIRCISSEGEVIWSYYNGQIKNGWGAPVMDKYGNIYFTNYYRPTGVPPTLARLTCIDYSGNHKWTHTFDIEGEEFTNTLIVDDDCTTYLGSAWGYYYYAIDKNGNLLWKIPLNDYEADNTSTIGSDGTLYIGVRRGTIAQDQVRTLIAVRDTGSTLINDGKIIIGNYELQQNYPNPFNPATQIKYSLAQDTDVTVKIYDVLGREVSELVNATLEAGNYNVNFNAEHLSSGVYIYRITASSKGRVLFSDAKQMLLMK